MRKGGSEKLGDWFGHTASKLWCWDLDLDRKNCKDYPMKPPDIVILKLWCSDPVAMRQDTSSCGPACCWPTISMKGWEWNVITGIGQAVKNWADQVQYLSQTMVSSVNCHKTMTLISLYSSHHWTCTGNLLFYCCCNKIPQTWWLKTTPVYYLPVL